MEAIPDEILLQSFPLLPVPSSGCVPEALMFGTRYLVGAGGLFRELTLPWLYAVVPMAPFCLAQTPYGHLEPRIEFRCGPLPLELLREFKAVAQAALPNEATAAIVWSEASGEWSLRVRGVVKATPHRIDYEEVKLNDGEHLVVDIHSHGSAPPFFSGQDDVDDYGALKIAAVIGGLGTGQGAMRARLVLPDRFLNLLLHEDGTMVVGEAA